MRQIQAGRGTLSRSKCESWTQLKQNRTKQTHKGSVEKACRAGVKILWHAVVWRQDLSPPTTRIGEADAVFLGLVSSAVRLSLARWQLSWGLRFRGFRAELGWRVGGWLAGGESREVGFWARGAPIPAGLGNHLRRRRSVLESTVKAWGRVTAAKSCFKPSVSQGVHESSSASPPFSSCLCRSKHD